MEPMAHELIRRVTLEEVNAVVSAPLQTDSRVVQVALPTAEDVTVPAEATPSP